MQPYRKRLAGEAPAAVEARQFTRAAAADVAAELTRRGAPFRIDPSDGRLYLQTADGLVMVDFGDWVVRDSDGRYSRCRPETFAEGFEPWVKG